MRHTNKVYAVSQQMTKRPFSMGIPHSLPHGKAREAIDRIEGYRPRCPIERPLSVRVGGNYLVLMAFVQER